MGDSSSSMLFMVIILLAIYFIGVGVYMAAKLIRKAAGKRKDRIPSTAGDAGCVPRCAFHQKARGGPAGDIVQPDDAAHVPAGFSVIPGADAFFPQKASGYIFARKDEQGIKEAPPDPGKPPEQVKDGRKQTARPVDGEHPEGGNAPEGEVPSSQGLQGSKDDFQAPAKDAAFDKIL